MNFEDLTEERRESNIWCKLQKAIEEHKELMKEHIKLKEEMSSLQNELRIVRAELDAMRLASRTPITVTTPGVIRWVENTNTNTTVPQSTYDPITYRTSETVTNSNNISSVTYGSTLAETLQAINAELVFNPETGKLTTNG